MWRLMNPISRRLHAEAVTQKCHESIFSMECCWERDWWNTAPTIDSKLHNRIKIPFSSVWCAAAIWRRCAVISIERQHSMSIRNGPSDCLKFTVVLNGNRLVLRYNLSFKFNYMLDERAYGIKHRQTNALHIHIHYSSTLRLDIFRVAINIIKFRVTSRKRIYLRDSDELQRAQCCNFFLTNKRRPRNSERWRLSMSSSTIF